MNLSLPQMIIRTLCRTLMLVGFLFALLAGAQVLPDPCLSGDDDCCSATSHSGAADCGTLCCSGIQATPAVVFQLDVPSDQVQAFETIIHHHEFIPSAPLVRPPISA